MKHFFYFSEIQYKLYAERWWIVICVALVYGGNYCHWIAIPSVGRVVAQYYNQPGTGINVVILIRVSSFYDWV